MRFDHDLNEARRAALAGRSNVGPVGLRWAENAPADWTVTTLQRLFTVSSGDFLSPGDLQEGGFPVFGGNGFRGYFRDTNCAANTMLIGRYGALCGNVHIPPEPFWATEHAFRVRPLIEYDQRYVARYVEALELRHLATRAAQPGLNSRMVREQAIALPDLATQKAIADFLDRETARVDQLIEKKQRFLSLADERWNSFLDRMIFGGQRDLDALPDGWRKTRLKYLTDPARPIMYGIVLPGPNMDEGPLIVKGGDVKPGRLHPGRLCRTTREIEASYKRSRLRAGDLVISIRGGIGDIEIVPSEIEGANLTQDAARIAPRAGLCNEWLRYSLLAPTVFFPLEAKAMGAAVKGINIFDLKRVFVPTPPQGEQRKISARLLEQERRLENLKSKVGQHADRLREYRAALITAAVTGQIDVATYGNQSATDRTLDRIEEEMER